MPTRSPLHGWLLITLATALATGCLASSAHQPDAAGSDADGGWGPDGATRMGGPDGGSPEPAPGAAQPGPGPDLATDAGGPDGPAPERDAGDDAHSPAGDAGSAVPADAGPEPDAGAPEPDAGSPTPPTPTYGLDSRPSNATCQIPDKLPTLLSETGCFVPATPWVPVTGLIPYEVNQPLWSDGASKRRFMALPDGTSLTVDPTTGDYEAPVGAVFIKEFSLGDRRVETRFIVRRAAAQWRTGAYIWKADGSDAELGSGNVDVDGVTWSVPSQGECNKCHTGGAGFSLGVEQAQLDAPIVYGATGRTANQVSTLIHLDMVDARAAVPPLPALESAAPAGQRARAYLHANCAGCHRPGEHEKFDSRWTTPFAQQGLCGVVPTANDFGSSETRLIKPGAPLESIVRLRLATTDSQRMPPLGTVVVHDEAVAVMDAWISGLTACP